VESESDLCKNEECLNIVSVKDKEIERVRNLVEKERREAALEEEICKEGSTSI